jgi:serine/threonine-protein kinase RsbW
VIASAQTGRRFDHAAVPSDSRGDRVSTARPPTDAFVADLRLTTDPVRLYLVRSMVAAIAIREDFDLDTIEDLKLVVDEMCATLIVRARPNTELACKFEGSAQSIGLVATVLSDSPEPIPRNTFGWRLLTTLADEVSSWITPDGDGHRVHIRFSKSAAMAIPG